MIGLSRVQMLLYGEIRGAYFYISLLESYEKTTVRKGEPCFT